MTKLKLAVGAVILLWIAGCATLQPGADPVVVRVEQTQTIALATFDAALSLDNSNREFWRTKYPGFHTWCEWMRAPVAVASAGKTLPRGSALLWDLNEAKKVYKAAKVKGPLVAALATVENALAQAQEFLTQTHNIH